MEPTNPILVVDDEVEMRIAMSTTLKRCGFKVDLSHSAADAINKFKKKDFSLVITDMTMPKKSGVELLKDIKSVNPNIPVIIMTAHGTIETAIEAMKHGAFDYILKPFDFDTIVFLIERALTNPTATSLNSTHIAKDTTKISAPRKGNRDSNKSSGDTIVEYRKIITEDPTMKELLSVAESVAKSKATVLIQSESGTGKELLARFIHFNSDREDKPFVAINCAALPETLLESELFGHKKGSFTGALADHKGKFEQANGGTILLDEISEMAPQLQAKLLRVLQEHVVDKIGGSEQIPIDIRVIATTNRNLQDYVDEGNFREDLYFRLNVIPMRLPPLRERKRDVKVLAEYFVKKYIPSSVAPKDCELADDTLRVLENYNWRGNVRELENVIERSVILSGGKKIMPNHLLMTKGLNLVYKSVGIEKEETQDESVAPDKELTLKEAEKKLVLKTMDNNGRDHAKVAKILGIKETELKKKLAEYE